MPADFKDKIALVTGAASGIGRATALGFAKDGAKLILLDVNREGVERTLADAGGDGVALAADLLDPECAGRAAKQAIDRLGGVDYLTNIAGYAKAGDEVLKVNVEMWRELLTVHLIAPAVFMRIVGQEMIERGTAGRIVNVSSSSAFRANTPACYASAKSGILGLTRAGAAELGKHGINVNAVVPGPTWTGMAAANSSEPDHDVVKSGVFANLTGRMSTSEDVASAILYLCRPESRQITGQAIHTSAGAVV